MDVALRPPVTMTGAGEADRQNWLAVFVIWAIVTAANLFKPFHIDDTAHLLIAQWIQHHPLHPMSGMLNWDGIAEPIARTNQPHLFFYLMAGWGALFGYSEIAMHSLLAIFSFIAIATFHRIARAVVPAHALWLTAMLAFGPAFVVNQNIMVDIPLLALWLLFFLPLVTAVDDPRQTRRFVLAGIACAGAVLIKYSSLVLVCVLGFQIVAERRWKQAWTVLIPIAALMAWSAFNIADYGAVHLLDRSLTPPDPNHKNHKTIMALGWLATLGGVVPLGFIALAEYWRRQRIALIVYAAVSLALILAAGLVARGQVADTAMDAWMARVFKLNAILMIFITIPHLIRLCRGNPFAIDHTRRMAVPILLLSWLIGTSLFYVLFSPFVATRHVLLVVPALLLLFGLVVPLPVRARWWGMGITAGIGALLAISDWHWADFQRSEAARITAEQGAGRRMWATSHHGWQWYATRAGMTTLDVGHSAMRPGDLLVGGRDMSNHQVTVGADIRLVRRDWQQPSFATLFCTSRQFGFYASSAGIPPWSISTDCRDFVDIRQSTGTRGG